jgi:hypothetical protein
MSTVLAAGDIDDEVVTRLCGHALAVRPDLK